MQSSITQSEWKLGINDPTVVAWVVWGLYVIATLLCWQSQRMSSKARACKKRPASWGVLSFVLFLLSVNKQLDLHTFVIQQLRRFHIGTTAELLVYVIICAIAATLFFIVWRRSWTTRMKAAAIALFSIVAFQALRFSAMPMSEFLSVHPLADDGVFHTHIIEVLELILIGFICYCAYSNSSLESGHKTSTNHQAAV